MDDLITCPAFLTHTHGVASCRLAPGHEGAHTAYCPICMENDDDSAVEWTQDGEDWTRRD